MKDGGPAFPVLYWSYQNPDGPLRAMAEGGMSLRQWYAGMALQGFCSTVILSHPEDMAPQDKPYTPDEIAELCFEYADAMIAQRDKE